MKPLKAKVQEGQLVLREPTDLPENTEIELVPVSSWDNLDDDDRRRLHEALAASEGDLIEGRVRPAEDVLADLAKVSQ